MKKLILLSVWCFRKPDWSQEQKFDDGLEIFSEYDHMEKVKSSVHDTSEYTLSTVNIWIYQLPLWGLKMKMAMVIIPAEYLLITRLKCVRGMEKESGITG